MQNGPPSVAMLATYIQYACMSQRQKHLHTATRTIKTTVHWCFFAFCWTLYTSFSVKLTAEIVLSLTSYFMRYSLIISITPLLTKMLLKVHLCHYYLPLPSPLPQITCKLFTHHLFYVLHPTHPHPPHQHNTSPSHHHHHLDHTTTQCIFLDTSNFSLSQLSFTMLGSVAPSLQPSCVCVEQYHNSAMKCSAAKIFLQSWMKHHDAHCYQPCKLFSYKLLAVVMFELPLCSQVQWLENAVATRLEGGRGGVGTTVTFFT